MHGSPEAETGVPPLEIRLHGRGGQGGVTCAKILAAVYAGLGRSVQTFGDYAGERAGAPVRAYTRVAASTITNRNKVYAPDHVLVLDPTLLGDDAVSGLAAGGTLLLNTSDPPEAFAGRFDAFRLATVDATAIARRHGIGTRSVVIVNTTIAGAFVRALGLPLEALEGAYRKLGFADNLPAAREAYDATRLSEAVPGAEPPGAQAAAAPPVLPLVEHRVGAAPRIATGSWRTQAPRYVERLAPCNANCPAGNDVVAFVQALALDGERAAAEVLGRTTPLAAVCGRVCPAPCMQGCNRRSLDGAVNVRALERWIADRAPVAAAARETSPRPRGLAVVGGGPAGLAAAYDLARRGHAVTLFDAEEELGGVLRTGIPAYRLPRDVLDREVDGILRLGVVARLGRSLAADDLAAVAADFEATILATGLQRVRDVQGAALGGVEQGLRFLRRANLSGDVRVAGHVVVLGGGNTAIDCARTALRCGADEVTVAYRRTRAEMPALPEEVEEAEEEGVAFRFLAAPAGFDGTCRVTAVRLADVELGPPDASGRRAPVVTDRVSSLPCDHVLLALGQSADASVLPAAWRLERGSLHGAPRVVVAAGDLATNDGTVAHAIGDGRRAAALALRALGEEVAVPERPDRGRVVDASEIRFDRFAAAAPAQARHEPPSERVRGFREVSRGIDTPLEAQRCFSCGHCTHCDTCLVYCPEGSIRRTGGGYAVDLTNCKGCGVCVTECPRRAMEMA